MGYYHLSVKTMTPADTCAAGVKADYILRQGAYAERGGLVAAGSGNMPGWVENPADYFYAADAYERKNGRLCKIVDAEIPIELVRAMSPAERVEFVDALMRSVADTPDGPLPYYWAIHDGCTEGKMHLHGAWSERVNDGIERDPETWFSRANSKTPESGGAKKTTALHPKEWLLALREHYADYCNDALREHGSAARIDHRSFADRGLDPGLATKHLGPRDAAWERVGIATPTGDYNRAVKARRAELGLDLTPKVEPETKANQEQVAAAAPALDAQAKAQDDKKQPAQAAKEPARKPDLTAPSADYYAKKYAKKKATQTAQRDDQAQQAQDKPTKPVSVTEPVKVQQTAQREDAPQQAQDKLMSKPTSADPLRDAIIAHAIAVAASPTHQRHTPPVLRPLIAAAAGARGDKKSAVAAALDALAIPLRNALPGAVAAYSRAATDAKIRPLDTARAVAEAHAANAKQAPATPTRQREGQER